MIGTQLIPMKTGSFTIYDGKRIPDTLYGYYLMDVGSLGWRQYWVSYVNSKMAAAPAYDGVFADGVYDILANDGAFTKTIRIIRDVR